MKNLSDINEHCNGIAGGPKEARPEPVRGRTKMGRKQEDAPRLGTRQKSPISTVPAKAPANSPAPNPLSFEDWLVSIAAEGQRSGDLETMCAKFRERTKDGIPGRRKYFCELNMVRLAIQYMLKSVGGSGAGYAEMLYPNEIGVAVLKRVGDFIPDTQEELRDLVELAQEIETPTRRTEYFHRWVAALRWVQPLRANLVDLELGKEAA